MVKDLNTVERDEYIESEVKQDILTALSEDIITDNIIAQITDSLNHQHMLEVKDIYMILKQKIAEINNKYGALNNDYPRVYSIMNEIFDRILNEFKEVYKFNLEFSQVASLEVKELYIENLYQFFVIDIYSNLKNLVVNFIMKNLDVYLKYINEFDQTERKNLSYKFLMNEIDNEYTPLIYHTKDIVNSIELNPDMMVIEDLFKLFITEENKDKYNIEVIEDIFQGWEWIDNINYETYLGEVLLEGIRDNNALILDVKLELIKLLKDSEEKE